MNRKIILVLLFILPLFTACTEEKSGVIVKVIDIQERPVPNAKVRLFTLPGNTILEATAFTDAEGQTYHEFDFECNMAVYAEVENYSFYTRLIGEGEITLILGETIKPVIQLHLP
jgi:hypothetical protein